MNTPSPLVPQGTQPQRGKSSLYFKVMMILTVHVVVIGGMLLQGCKDTAKPENKESGTTQTAQNDTQSPGAPSTSTTSPDASVPPSLTSTAAISNQAVSTLPSQVQTLSAPSISAPPIASMPASQSSPAISSDGREYVIAAGDTLAAIAKKNSVSLKALVDANPGVSPKKLRIGHKLQIPASGAAVAYANPAAASTMSATTPAESSAAGSSATYIVKSGDTLGKIARNHGTSFKKIMAINDLKTTAIHVGQKLKMPAPKPAGADAAPSSASLSSTAAASPGPVSSVSAPVSASPSGVAN